MMPLPTVSPGAQHHDELWPGAEQACRHTSLFACMCSSDTITHAYVCVSTHIAAARNGLSDLSGL
eukprot:364463-Chlamydomonas_euryale.AAC.5